jgi:glycerol-3-phosphate dehydrogenase
MDEETLQEIQVEVAQELEGIQTSADVYAFIEKHFQTEEYRRVYRHLYQNQRSVMGYRPRQALKNVLSMDVSDMLHQ